MMKIFIVIVCIFFALTLADADACSLTLQTAFQSCFTFLSFKTIVVLCVCVFDL